MSKALLRNRVLAVVAGGASHRDAGERFGVSAASVSRLSAIGAESCGVEQRQALPHKPCWAQTRERRRQAVPGPFCLLALTRSRSTHPYRGIAPETKPDFGSPTSGTGHLQSLSRQSTQSLQ